MTRHDNTEFCSSQFQAAPHGHARNAARHHVLAHVEAEDQLGGAWLEQLEGANNFKQRPMGTLETLLFITCFHTSKRRPNSEWPGLNSLQKVCQETRGTMC